MGWSHTRYFTNRSTTPFDRGQGWNWDVQNWPYLVRTSFPDAPVALLGQAYSIDWFKPNPDGTYTTLYGRLKKLIHVPDAGQIRLEDADGTVYVFNDFGAQFRPGLFVSVTTPGGNTTAVTDYSGGNVLEVRRSFQVGADTVTESFLYAFIAAGDQAGHVEKVTLRRQTNGGPWGLVLEARYTYYDGTSSFGSLNDLQKVERWEWTASGWAQLDASCYRYWTTASATGQPHLVKFALGPEAFAKAVAAGVDPLTASDASVAQYADHYFEYDGDGFATKEVTYGGSRTYTMEYTANPNYDPAAPEDFNFWMRKTVETLPDGTKNVVFCNSVGYTMLKVVESGADRWYAFNYFDEVGRESFTATSAAVSGYDETANDLLVRNPATGLFQYLRDDAGLIRQTEYYTTTGGGAAAGYVRAKYVRQGQLGTPVILAKWEYGSHTAADGVTVFPVSKETVYRNEDGTGAVDTTYAYTWHSNGGLETNQVLQKTTNLPVVPAAQNGSGTAESSAEAFDILGHRTWAKDPRGFITKFEYDAKTGAITRRIDDVDTAQVSDAPAGWITPAGGGLNLVTDFEIDDQGRTTQALGPEHTVDLAGIATAVRTATWTVYDDPDRTTLNGTGYKKSSDGTYTLVNPVSIRVTDQNGNVTDEITAVRGTTAGKLLPTDTFPQSSYVAWKTYQYADCCKLLSSRVYHTIPASGDGGAGTNYDQTTYGYDVRDRRNSVTLPGAGGTITFTVFDARSLPVATYVGTNDTGATDTDPTGGGAAGNNMALVSANEYDGGVAGGDGNLTKETRYASGADTRVTTYAYDWRDRRTATDGEVDFYEQVTYDNLDRVTKTERYNTTAAGTLVARAETYFDDRGRVYRTKRYAVNPNTGVVGNALTGDVWYDASGNVLKSVAAGANKLAKKSAYDSLNRLVKSYVGYDLTETGYAAAGDVTGDTILEQAETAYDDAGNTTSVTSRRRYHSATGTGPLQGPTGTEPRARVTYVASWSDAIGRTRASADYGTNGGAAFARPSTAPARGDSVLVTARVHDDAGRTSSVIDPAGTETRTEYDDAGRRTKLIENFVDGVVSTAAPDEDRTTLWTYTPDGQVATLTAVNPSTGNQVTTYVYGTTTAEGPATSTLLRRVKYPDSTGDADSVAYWYNRLGERVQVRDQNGTTHVFEYDKLGRPVQDRVTALGTNIDGAVRRLSTTYDVRGLVTKLTSYDNATVGAGAVVNEVERDYDAFGQLATEYQSHAGAVVTASTPKVGYTYADGSANTVRPASLAYPSTRTLLYGYGSGADRLTSISDTGVAKELVNYSYLGLNTVVEADDQLPTLRFTLVGTAGGIDPDTGDIYRGLDRFGRVKDALWQNYAAAVNAPAAELRYGYDRAGSRTWREDAVAVLLNKSFDELYAHDGLDRIAELRRGRLNAAKDAIASPTFWQLWSLDATGNWLTFKEDADGNGVFDLVQWRTANPANEVSGITNTTGAAWAVPAYDAAGEMRTLSKPSTPGQPFTATYDAWGRLVRVADGASIVQENAYDAARRRTVRNSYSGGSLAETRHYYYSADWRILEERLGTAATPARQSVWGARYVDDLVFREEYNTSGVLTRRLYALQDANWNVVAITNTAGAVLERYAYQAYGRVAVLDASFLPPASSQYDWETFFAGYRLDGTGLYQVRNRFLHSRLGAWVTRDPSGYDAGQPSLYVYASSKPLDTADPSGLLDLAKACTNQRRMLNDLSSELNQDFTKRPGDDMRAMVRRAGRKVRDFNDRVDEGFRLYHEMMAKGHQGAFNYHKFWGDRMYDPVTTRGQFFTGDLWGNEIWRSPGADVSVTGASGRLYGGLQATGTAGLQALYEPNTGSVRFFGYTSTFPGTQIPGPGAQYSFSGRPSLSLSAGLFGVEDYHRAEDYTEAFEAVHAGGGSGPYNLTYNRFWSPEANERGYRARGEGISWTALGQPNGDFSAGGQCQWYYLIPKPSIPILSAEQLGRAPRNARGDVIFSPFQILD